MRINLPNPTQFSRIFKSALGKSLDIEVQGIATDSREIQKGDLYIAIPGERVDGHSFLVDVFDKGADAALVSKSVEGIDGNQILVEDTINAIGKVSTLWREQFDFPIIGITGSNGKTSTKELLKHILSAKFDVHATEGNYNTSIGVPLTLLQLTSFYGASVIEMGASQPGEIKKLCNIANPTHGLITNVSPAHLEGFGTIENVAKTKGALFESLSKGISFVNVTDNQVSKLKIFGDKVTFGLTPDCNYPADLHHEEDSTITLTINAQEVPTNSTNLSFAKNVIATVAIAQELGLEWDAIIDRIQTFIPPKGRCEVKNNGKITIIDDTYNANLESTMAAIDYLKAFSGNGQSIFVFGDMLELGDSSIAQHQTIGNKCNDSEINAILTIGTETIATDGALLDVDFHRHFNNKDNLLKSLNEIVQDGDKVLVKGSRGMRMETIVEAMLSQ
jgi:UDP-N-acetylmuramoyl-tripeptide--D-alanyl-D-alanine ligase